MRTEQIARCCQIQQEGSARAVSGRNTRSESEDARRAAGKIKIGVLGSYIHVCGTVAEVSSLCRRVEGRVCLAVWPVSYHVIFTASASEDLHKYCEPCTPKFSFTKRSLNAAARRATELCAAPRRARTHQRATA